MNNNTVYFDNVKGGRGIEVYHEGKLIGEMQSLTMSTLKDAGVQWESRAYSMSISAPKIKRDYLSPYLAQFFKRVTIWI